MAGAGGAAHLPGMLAAHTVLPVLGVPVQSKALQGLDSLLSIVQMPGGVPVGTMAIGTAGATNAGLLAAAIVSGSRPDLRERLRAWRQAQTAEVLAHPDPAGVTTVGVLGGGQLGRMLALAAAPLGIESWWWSLAPDPPAAVAAEVIQAPYGDPSALAELARRCDVVTVELEGVPIEALAWLAERVPVRPSAGRRGGRAGPPGREGAVRSRGHPDGAVGSGPGHLRGRHHRQGPPRRLRRPEPGAGRDRAMTSAALLPGLDGGEVISEGVVGFDRELSIIAARGLDGETACYPLVENHHTRGILRANAGAGARLFGRRCRLRPKASPVTSSTPPATSAWWPSSCSRSATTCWPTRWPRGCTTPATGRSKAP